MLPRREFIQTASAFAGSALLIPACGIKPDIATTAFAADAIDEALMLISKLAPLGNHAPMAVESLVTLGRPELLIQFVEKYSRRFGARHPVSVGKIDASNWKAALGRTERNLDWTSFFQRELKETGWKAVVEKWSEILAPGLSAAAGHGVIRTCHAVRSLSRRETAPRLDELAEGLGYWAAFYQPLPEPGSRSADYLSIADAVERIPILPEERRRRGSIMEQLRSLNDFSDFADVIDQIEISGGSDALLSKLTETFARIYAERATDRNDLNLLHAVTVTSGVRSLIPYLSPATSTRVIRYGWQTAAAMIAISGSEVPPMKAVTTVVAKDDLVERAVSSNEEHSIKFTEACIREHQLNPNAIYLQAASEAVRRLPRH